MAEVASQEGWDLLLADSCEQVSSGARRLSAPVILVDRDWPGTVWKDVVENLAGSHDASVVLVSGVADAYLWQELIRRDGYDILPKPVRPEDVARIVRLAYSYWNIRRSQTRHAGRKSEKRSRVAI